MLFHRAVLLLGLVAPYLSSAQGTAESFDEELVLRPLPDGKLSLLFEYKLQVAARRRHGSGIDIDSRTLSPPALLLPLIQNDVSELHLSMVAGKWDLNRWHDPLGSESGGTGAEVRAYIREGGESSVNDKWTAITNALAGLFCSSLGQISPSITASPVDIFPPSRPLPDGKHTFLHAQLPSENLCTENLTPFLKLLPCKGISGLSSLMKPHSLLAHAWQGLGLDVSIDEQGNGEVKMWWEAVVDTVEWKNGGRRDFSISSIFKQTIPLLCPIARTSHIYLIGENDKLQLGPESPLALKQGGKLVWDLHDDIAGKDIRFRWDESNFEYPDVIPLPPIGFSRVLAGATQTSGGFHIIISNYGDRPRDVVYVEALPWYIKPWMRKMEVFSAGDDAEPNAIDYEPAIDRIRPTLLRIYLTVAAGEQIHVRLPFTKSFIRYSEHPPDASRGFDLPPAILHIDTEPSEGNTTQRQRIYSTKLLVDVAIPDFSMPYNVIIMTSTLIALFFGSVFNPIVRRFGVVEVPMAKVDVVS